MKIEGYFPPKSSFLSAEKDMEIIVQKILSNERLKKYLYYTVPSPLEQPKLTDEQITELFHNNIKRKPKIYVDGSVLNYLIIQFDNFIENNTNPEFRDNMIEFDIICHMDQWELKDYQLRPYRIAAELDTMLDKKRLTGIGKLEFVGASQIILNNEFAGLCLLYRAVHGGEDKIGMLNPEDNKDFAEDYKEMIDAQKEAGVL